MSKRQRPVFETQVHNNYYEAEEQPTLGAQLLSILGALLTIALIVIALTVGAAALLALPALAVIWLLWKFPRQIGVAVGAVAGLGALVFVLMMAAATADSWVPTVIRGTVMAGSVLAGVVALAVAAFLIMAGGTAVTRFVRDERERRYQLKLAEAQRPQQVVIMVQSQAEAEKVQMLLGVGQQSNSTQSFDLPQSHLRAIELPTKLYVK